MSNITHWSTYENAVGQRKVVGDTVEGFRKENCKTDFKIWSKNSKLQSERENIEMVLPPLDSIHVGVKTSDTKTPETEYLEHK